MSRVTVSLLVGLILGVVTVFGSFGALITVIAFGAIGLVVGLVLDGRLDLQGLIGRASERR